MNTRQHPRTGPRALALDVRVIDAGPREVRLVMRPAALERAERRWLEEHHEGRAWDPREPLWNVRLARSLLDPRPDELASCALMRGALEAWCAPLSPPAIMGILNITPDSFSDGGRHQDPAVAIEAGLRFVQEGARWIDVGGESTRPGARPVALEEESARVLPVISGLARAGLTRISVDTRHSQVARAALDAGASMVNDVGAGLDDQRMLGLVAEVGCEYVLMHRQGAPPTMQTSPRYGDVVAEVGLFLRQRVAACLQAGIDEERLWIDPGIGFGKRLEHNLALFRRLAELRSLGIPLLVGPSRKAFIAHLSGAQEEADWARLEARDAPLERLGGTAAAISFCVAGGVKVLRVHDVAVMSEACAVASAIQASPL